MGVRFIKNAIVIKIDIPGKEELIINHLVLDYNGTLALDGQLIDGLQKLLNTISDKIKIHIITADTFGKVRENIQNINATLHILGKQNQSIQKLNYIKKLDSPQVCAIGNGNNDSLMLKYAALGIALVQAEGLAFKTLSNADIVCSSIFDALGLLQNPQRLIATLRD